MESEEREPRRPSPGSGRARQVEQSPGGSVKRAREMAAAAAPAERPMPPSILNHSAWRNAYKGPSPPKGNSYGMPNKSGGSPVSPGQSPRQGGPTQSRSTKPNMTPSPTQGTSFADSPASIHPRRARNHWEDPNALSAGEESFSSSSRPSTMATGSSTASIPDFPTIPSMPSMPNTPPVPAVPQMPVPTYQPPPRRNLGPPPSARKGGSSYYSQNSFVPVIPEENSDAHSSYASSQNVIPVSWGDGPPEYYMGSPGIEEEDEGSSNAGSSGRTSMAGDHSEESNLVRKGSRGKPLQPYMETLESEDESLGSSSRLTRELEWQARQDERSRGGFGNASAPGTDPIGRHNFKNNARLQHNPYSGYESDATFLDSPRAGSPDSMGRGFANHNNKSNNYFGTPESPASPVDPRVASILGHLEKGGALSSSGSASPSLSTAPLASEKGLKRPPPLNLDAREKGPGRGSATSLPELIRRATRLATNLDRGNTASRIGMLDMLNASDKEKRERGGKVAHSQTGSISDILANFPSPSPTTSTYPKPSNWTSPSPYAKSALSRTQTINYGSSSRSDVPRSRRCCGMPIWALILVILIILLLIAAAVVIPITLVVIPRENAPPGPSVDSCKKSNPCSNGGIVLVAKQQCRCICVNGYTGSTCTGPPVTDGSCTTFDIPPTGSTTTSYHSATFGTAVPRILSAAFSNYSLPLHSDQLASLFSMTNLSCTSENALLTFSQKSSRRLRRARPVSLRDLLGPSPTIGEENPTRVLLDRANTPAQTSSNGIIFAAPNSNGMGGAGAPSGSSTPSASAPSAASSSTNSSTGATPITQSTLDFARSAILFVFQESSSLATTTDIMEKLQATLGSDRTTFDGSQNAISGNVTIDLVGLTVGLGNGTLYGGKVTSS